MIYVVLTMATYGAIMVTLILQRSGRDGFGMQDRIDLWTILRRTSEIMAQIDDLVIGLNAVASDVDALEQKLTDLQNNPPVGQPTDLTPALDIVARIRSGLEGTTSTAQSQWLTPGPTQTARNSLSALTIALAS